MNIVVIKYNAGNTQSVANALDRLNVKYKISNEPDEVRKADKVLFPGVGEASSAMSFLHENNLTETLKTLTRPVLGICLGLQLFCSHSEENDTDCLGIINTPVKKFIKPENDNTFKIPHMGWNTIYNINNPLFKGIEEGSYVYFVHSYYAALCHETIAQTDYGVTYSSALQKDNYYAVQFHPEKSGETGAKILKNFTEL